LTHESESISGGAVQIGNAITEKMLLDVILEARDRGLYHAITDCGAGGFSSAVGEMGEETGAEVWLDKAPLKYAGLTYTEIWISEAQERMVLAVPPEHWDEFRELCASEGVEATAIGRFTDTRGLLLKYDGQQVGDLSMEFLHGGRPPIVREAVYQRRSESNERRTAKSQISGLRNRDHGETLKKILSCLNVCSKEWIIRQYDHEVQAGSVVKPLVGVASDGPSDAAVVRPDLASKRGLVISCGMNPRYGDFDPYWMAAGAIDEAVRNCVAVGADPRRIAILDNFCWGNTEKPEQLGSLVRAARGCHDAAVAFGTPFVSGKDSLNNEFTYVEGSGVRGQGSGGQRTIAIPPSLLITALGQIESVEQAVTMDLKEAGNTLYLVGRTYGGGFGGSHYNLVHGIEGGEVPQVDLQNAPLVFEAVHQAIRSGLVRSCHDLSEGGLAVALAEMAFAGGLGVQASLTEFETPDETALFSESNTRFVLEIRPEQAAAVEKAIPFALRLGRVTSGDRLVISGHDGRKLIDEGLSELKRAWQAPLRWD
jgi:phosphoribosylformylglycinamidine synthase